MLAQHLIKRLLLYVLFVGVCFNFVPAQAQDSTPQQPRLIVEGILPDNLDWSDQSLLLAFNDVFLSYGIVEEEFDTWYQFDIDQEVLVQGNKWPLQPALPSALEGQALPNGVMLSSPSGRYIVFPSPYPIPGRRGGSEVRIYDTQQSDIIDTGLPSGGGASSVEYFQVEWGNDTRFVMETIPEEGGLPTIPDLYYVSLNGTEVSFHLLTTMTLQDRPVIVFEVFDVSSDGSKVLLRGRFIDESPTVFLGIWDVQAPNDLLLHIPRIPPGQIDVLTVVDAKFTNPDGTEFVFFDDQGIGRYNVSTESVDIINNQVTAQTYRHAEFSPSAEVLALADDTAVYWLDLRSN